MCCLTACATTKTKEQKEAEARQTFGQIADSVNNRSFTIELTYVIPRKLQPRFLTSDYSVRVHGDSITSFLPYFGVAYRADMNSRYRSPLDFEGLITDYSADWKKKKKMQVKMKTKNNMDYMTYSMDIFTNGTVTLDVIPTDREPITFNGRLILNE